MYARAVVGSVAHCCMKDASIMPVKRFWKRGLNIY